MAGDLLDGLRRGDAAAYREAVRVHGPALYSFLLRLAGRKEVADDLFQETWLALARHATRLRADTRLEAWLFTVARNAHRSHRRWRWADLSRWLVDEDVEAVATTPSPEDAAARSQEARAVETALATLRPAEREVLLLAAQDGLSAAEAAVMLGVAPEAYRQRLHRARSALTAALDRLLRSSSWRSP